MWSADFQPVYQASFCEMVLEKLHIFMQKSKMCVLYFILCTKKKEEELKYIQGPSLRSAKYMKWFEESRNIFMTLDSVVVS